MYFAVLPLTALACEARPPAGARAEPPYGERAPETSVPLSKVPSPSPLPSSALSDVKVGAPVPPGAAMPLAELLSASSAFSGKTVLVEGEVRRACSKKGCWMELATSHDLSAAGCRVTFKDYGFFVPTNASGAHARLAGEVVVKTLRKSHVDHLEAEGARFTTKNSDGSAVEVQIVATGVELRKS